MFTSPLAGGGLLEELSLPMCIRHAKRNFSSRESANLSNGDKSSIIHFRSVGPGALLLTKSRKFPELVTQLTPLKPLLLTM